SNNFSTHRRHASLKPFAKSATHILVERAKAGYVDQRKGVVHFFSAPAPFKGKAFTPLFRKTRRPLLDE
ncbi:MAG: hypothetical protein V1644_03515, partial [Candidatus Micrarchaeota archaeon]